ncbi:MAG: tyrosine-type recombinase/integrase [Burkholderiales bacterium]|nr:tyrosine-type recombinase/integrase [Burkholderiales bacterium]
MSELNRALDAYLRLRRSLGAELRGPEVTLRRFVEFLEAKGAAFVTTDLALRFATASETVAPATRAQRLGDIRRFAAFLSVSDPRTEIPPRRLLPERYRRCPPYIYSEQEIARIVGVAARLPSHVGLRGHTCATLFGLLASTGLRLGEAVGLDRDDVDLAAGILTVRRAKYGKSRLVPMHDTTTAALSEYGHARDRLVPRSASPAFFLSERGRRLLRSTAQYNFAVVSRIVGLRPPTTMNRHGRGPRIHDLRHALAVHVLIGWYREGRDVERELPRLSTYLGHVHIADTYWYISGVPELLELATERASAPREVAR